MCPKTRESLNGDAHPDDQVVPVGVAHDEEAASSYGAGNRKLRLARSFEGPNQNYALGVIVEGELTIPIATLVETAIDYSGDHDVNMATAGRRNPSFTVGSRAAGIPVLRNAGAAGRNVR